MKEGKHVTGFKMLMALQLMMLLGCRPGEMKAIPEPDFGPTSPVGIDANEGRTIPAIQSGEEWKISSAAFWSPFENGMDGIIVGHGSFSTDINTGKERVEEPLPDGRHKLAYHQSNGTASSGFNLASPSLLFTEEGLRDLQDAVRNDTASLKAAYDNLIIVSDTGLLYHTTPYLGDDSMEFYMKLREPAGLARDLALAYALTEGEVGEKYGLKAVELMKTWAEKCNGITYNQYAGTGMLIVRSVFPMLSAYDILKDEDIMDTGSKEKIESWFRWLVPQVWAGVGHWEENDYFNKQYFQNHLASHTLGLLAFGVVLEDGSLIQLGLDSPDNPRDLYEMIEGAILMEGDTPHHREIQAPPPADGEIYDRYRHDTNPLRGLGYAHLTLSQLALSAHILKNIGLDVFSYSASGGENLLLPFEYYSDFYRLQDACIKHNYYCGETNLLGKRGDGPGMFELGLANYPESQPLRDLIDSGVFDRGTAYNDLLGFTRLYTYLLD